jgi:ADP-ribose pyrophosphatase YjhB (NUDIX family)
MLRWLLWIWRPLPGSVKHVYLRLRYGWHGVGVQALIRDERGRILLVRRTYSNDEPWALPGGWLEGTEAIESGLERELFEETGLRVRVVRVSAVENAGFAVMLLMEAVLLDTVMQFRPSAEVSDIAWVELSEVRRLSRLNASLLGRALGVKTF